jgi:hypothetical protein
MFWAFAPVQIGRRCGPSRNVAGAGRSELRSCRARAALHSECWRRSPRREHRYKCLARRTSTVTPGWVLRKALAIGGRMTRATKEGDIELQPARRRITKACGRIERGGDFAERRAQALKEPLASFGRRHAAARTVEKAHAEPRVQTPNRFAVARGRHPAQHVGAAKGAGAGDGGETVEIGDAGHVRFPVQGVGRRPAYRAKKVGL